MTAHEKLSMSPALVETLWRPPLFDNHPAPRPRVIRRGLCENVVDGDTYDALVEFGIDVYRYCRVRISGVDCPEIFHPKTDQELQLGLKAKAAAQDLLLNKPIMLDFGSEEQIQGRMIAKVQYHTVSSGWQDMATYLTEHHLLKSDVVIPPPTPGDIIRDELNRG